MQANLEDTVEDDDALYQKLISKSIDADTSGPESTSSRTSIGSKVNVPAAQQKVQVVNSTSIAPDVVIEVEGTQQARDRGHVIIAIDNPDPNLEVQIVVRKKKKGLCCLFRLLLNCLVLLQATWLVKHRDQSAARKKISRLHFKLTLRTSDTVHVPVRLIGSHIFLLRNESRTSRSNL